MIIPPEQVTIDFPPGHTRRLGTVFRGYWNDSLVAVKLLSDEAPVDVLIERMQTWQLFRHPHVLQVFGISPDATPPFVISQYYANGNVNDYLSNNPTADRAEIMFGCALGMRYLHERELVHGSLKPTNILVAENGQPCIGDYCMIELKRSGGAHSKRYSSPEAWKGINSCASDVFAFAMSAYEIFFGIPPWGNLSEDEIFKLVVREDERPDRLGPDLGRQAGLTDRIWEILQAGWRKEITSRPTFAQIVHMWRDQAVLEVSETMPITSTLGNSAGVTRAPPQRPLDNLRAWHPGPDPRTTSGFDGPPAYSDITAGRELPTRPIRRNRSGTRSLNAVLPIRPSIANSLPSENCQLTRQPGFSGLERTQSMPIRPARVNTPSNDSTFSSEMAVIPENQVESVDRSPPAQITSGVLGLHRSHSWAPTWMSESQRSLQVGARAEDSESIRSGSQTESSSTPKRANAVLLAGALRSEFAGSRRQEVIDEYLRSAQVLSLQSPREVQKLVTAGMVPTVIDLLKARAVQDDELGIVLVTLGLLACDLITANIIYRTDTTSTLMEIINSSHSDDNATVLSIWCLNRICRSAELAAALIKQNVVATLLKGLNGSRTSARLSAWCLGSLVYTNDLAETLASYDVIPASAEYLRGCTGELNVEPGDICAGLFLVARMARTIPLSRALERAGCVPFVVHHLSTSEHAQVLNWSARAVGCLLRPNALDLAKNLLEVGTAKALARLPHVLQAEEIEPLSSFAFAIHRFSVAEWGAGTRKALVDAGVVDSLLSALRTAADVLYPQVLIELALAVSALVDIGGASIRKEIVRAGGVEILQRVGAKGLPEVEKACNIAVTSITGNFWTRHAAIAKTTMAHTWNGGCPEYQPPCPPSLAH